MHQFVKINWLKVSALKITDLSGVEILPNVIHSKHTQNPQFVPMLNGMEQPITKAKRFLSSSSSVESPVFLDYKRYKMNTLNSEEDAVDLSKMTTDQKLDIIISQMQSMNHYITMNNDAVESLSVRLDSSILCLTTKINELTKQNESLKLSSEIIKNRQSRTQGEADKSRELPKAAYCFVAFQKTNKKIPGQRLARCWQI